MRTSRPSRPASTALLPAGALVLAAACGGDPEPRPSVLLITVDTLRADHLGAYGAEEARTPHVDALAEAGTLFENAAAPMPMTRPSHFSIFTSLYPREHGVVNNALALPDEAASLPELFRARGWRTAGFVGVTLLGAGSGGTQGFEHFDEPQRTRERPASDVVPPAVRWLEGLGEDEPFFLWVHLFDPHLPYAPPEPFRRGLDPKLAAVLPSVSWAALEEIARRNGGDVPRPVLEHALDLYRGEVELVDHWIGELTAALERGGRADETVVCFTADHGESFEHGVFFEHADCLLEGAVRIPLIVRWPRGFAAGARVAEQVSAVDVAPTLLRAAGLSVPASFSGRALQDAASFGDRYVLVQHPLYQPGAAERRSQRLATIRSVAGEPTRPILADGEKTGLVGREWRLLRHGEKLELYRRSPEEGESRDFAGERGAPAAELEARLDALLRERPLRVLDPGLVSEDLLETLEALGYAY